jgi:hypothetical protein
VRRGAGIGYHYVTSGKSFMLFSPFVGMVLGAGQLPTPAAILILVIAVGAKILVDLRWYKTPLIGRTSPYVRYCENLERAGESIEQAWLSYAMQLFVFGNILGIGAFALMRWLT